MIYYNLYTIYEKIGQPKEAKKFINLSHKEIIKIASNLKRKDKNRLLTKNIFVANVISDWEKLKN